MRIIEISEDKKEYLCNKLRKAKDAIEDLERELKETTESDTRMWRAEGDYRANYPRMYRDDFRYRY